MKKIVVASGKGGTGKTTVAASIISFLSNSFRVVAADCDVDTPNLKLIFAKDEQHFNEEDIITSEKVFVDEKKCDASCKKCVDVCNFGALEWDDKEEKLKVKRIYCEGCGACTLVCPEVLRIKPVNNGVLRWTKQDPNFAFVYGELKVGESETGNIVVEVKNKALEIAKEMNADFFIVDASAGIGCPVIASLTDMDYAILVTEPTPSGISDLYRMLELVNHFGMKNSIVINKYNLSRKLCTKINEIAARYETKIIAKIPYDVNIVKATNMLIPMIEFLPNYNQIFEDIVKDIFSF